jgi:branched-chain amino acid transport system permease protein
MTSNVLDEAVPSAGPARSDDASPARRWSVARLVTPRRALMGLALAAAVAWPFAAPSGTWFFGCLAVIYAMVALSLTVLSGWTAQISLGHAAFLGLGVYTIRPLLAGGVPVVLAVLLAGVVAAAVSLLLGVPSLRLRGIYLAIVTLAFGMFSEGFLFPLEAFSGGGIAYVIERPTLVASDRALYLALLVPLGLCLLVVRRLRNSNVGRVLFAIRDSEDAAQSMGVRLAPYKIGVFALSAGITGAAGGLYGLLIGATPAGGQFGVLQSWFFLAMPVIGGLEYLSGALVGAALLAFAQPLVQVFELRILLASGALTIAVVLMRTGGIVGAVMGWRDRFKRAAGAGPSPTAAFDPEATEDTTAVPASARLALGPDGPAEGRLRLAIRREPA